MFFFFSCFIFILLTNFLGTNATTMSICSQAGSLSQPQCFSSCAQRSLQLRVFPDAGAVTWHHIDSTPNHRREQLLTGWERGAMGMGTTGRRMATGENKRQGGGWQRQQWQGGGQQLGRGSPPPPTMDNPAPVSAAVSNCSQGGPQVLQTTLAEIGRAHV